MNKFIFVEARQGKDITNINSNGEKEHCVANFNRKYNSKRVPEKHLLLLY